MRHLHDTRRVVASSTKYRTRTCFKAVKTRTVAGPHENVEDVAGRGSKAPVLKSAKSTTRATPSMKPGVVGSGPKSVPESSWRVRRAGKARDNCFRSPSAFRPCTHEKIVRSTGC